MAAMMLPAFADTQPVESTVSMGVSNYREADIAEQHVAGGDSRRYDVGIRQFKLLTPVGRQWSFGLDMTRETMSGASPWATVAGPDGQPALIMSGATIEESRTEVGVSVAHHAEDRSIALTLTRSTENDYRATAPSLAGEWTFNDGLTTVSAALSHSSDTIRPTDAALYGRVTEEKRRSGSASVGLAQVLDRSSAAFVGVSVTDHTGYLSDPYKLRDVRPDGRLERVLGVRYRRFLDTLDAALHLDYRHYRDDWGVVSHTLLTSWYQNVGTGLQVVPNVRYYSQSAADFFRPVDDFGLPLDVHQSSDFRLSAYGALTFGLKGIIRQPRWTLTISADRYIGSEKYGLSKGVEHPARLSFTLASVVYEVRF